jgi:hypothetical protein
MTEPASQLGDEATRNRAFSITTYLGICKRQTKLLVPSRSCTTMRSVWVAGYVMQPFAIVPCCCGMGSRDLTRGCHD